MSRWSYPAGTREIADLVKLNARARKQAPDLVNEWIGIEPGGWENARRHLRAHGVPVPTEAAIASIGPLTVRQLNLFAHKATLALHFHVFQTAIPAGGGIYSSWRSKEDLAVNGIPQALIEMMPEYTTLIQGKWNLRQTFECRFAKSADDGLFGTIARFRHGFFAVGFTVADWHVLPPHDADWVEPAAPTALLDVPAFAIRR